jgi:aspartate-semialdehyde dehydrogenase
LRIAVIGATGVVGREIVADLLALAESRDISVGTPRLFASGKTAGEVVGWAQDEDIVVEPYEPDAVRGLDAAIVATPRDAAPAIVARLRQLGVTAIDLSRTHRDQAPLFIDGVLAPAGTSWANAPVISLPSAEALALARVVNPLQAMRPRWVRVSLLKAASGAGQAGVDELAESTGRLLNGQEPENPMLGHRLAFNTVPQAGAFTGADTEAELDLQRELRRLSDGLPVACTVAWGPWFFGLSATVTLGFEAAVQLDQVRAAWEQAKHVKVLDEPKETIYPMPSLATGDDAVLAGRLRIDPLDPRAVQFVLAMDNARATAAMAVSALQMALQLKQAH